MQLGVAATGLALVARSAAEPLGPFAWVLGWHASRWVARQREYRRANAASLWFRDNAAVARRTEQQEHEQEQLLQESAEFMRRQLEALRAYLRGNPHVRYKGRARACVRVGGAGITTTITTITTTTPSSSSSSSSSACDDELFAPV